MVIEEATDDDLQVYYRKASVFIMPSRELGDGDVEGFGIVYLEANSFGLPVIAGRSGGVVEAVENGVNGLLVDPVNVDEIKQAIISLIENKEKAKELGLRGQQRATEEFSWFDQATKIIKNIN